MVVESNDHWTETASNASDGFIQADVSTRGGIDELVEAVMNRLEASIS